jgi:hypothetical protein
MTKKIIYSIFILFNCVVFLTACRGIKEIPVQTVEKLVYKDSLIYIKDTLKVEIPKETIIEVVPDIDTSFLKTSLAESIAYLDTTERKLHHTLTQKGNIEIEYDTIVKVQYVDRIIEKEIPVQVDVIKYKRDALFWVLVAWALLCIGYAGLKIYFKKFI